MTDGLTKGIDIDKCFNALNRKDLIVIEDFGLFPATEASIQLLFRLIDRRFGMGALLITSQYKVADWYGYFAGEQNNNALADAVMDRLRNNSQNIELKGPSLRGGGGGPPRPRHCARSGLHWQCLARYASPDIANEGHSEKEFDRRIGRWCEKFGRVHNRMEGRARNRVNLQHVRFLGKHA